MTAVSAATAMPVMPVMPGGNLLAALAALLLASALDSAARAIGDALASPRRPAFQIFVPAPVRSSAVPRPAGLARGYGERAPPLLRRP